jgi:integrase
MNVLNQLSVSDALDETPVFGQAIALFPVEGLQYLDADSALRCQKILGHGGTYGVWETPEAMVPYMPSSGRRVDLRRRIAAYLPKGTTTSLALDGFLDEAVLWLTRLALLTRLGPAVLSVSVGKSFKSLDASTLSNRIVQCLPKLAARGIARRLEDVVNSKVGFASALNADDLQEFWAVKSIRNELRRMTQLHDLGYWSYAPTAREFRGKTTKVRGIRTTRPPECNGIPHPPIPDDYLAAMGPRVLWLIKDLGPNLIHLLQTLPTMLTSGNAAVYTINRRINLYFETNVWLDRNGQVIEKPPFEFQHGSSRGKHLLRHPERHNACVWPPSKWSSVQALAVSLQSAHLWVALLVMAARIGEVATLKRDCIEFARDGQIYANGKTYKPSRAFSGRNREWPIPAILVDVFAQQVKLVEASARLARVIKDTQDMAEVLGDGTHLWASLGVSRATDATKKIGIHGFNLQSLASRIGLTHKPGGKNLHPHRFRKTMARLAGLAIDGSQKVLMLLLGHEDVTTTLGYMQTDPAFAKEVDDITRELRVIRGEALIEDMRVSLQNPAGIRYGGHGGGGAPVLSEAVRSYTEELHRRGEEWGVDTARELSVLLTNNGESARLISAHVICTKTAGEVGLCSSKKGAIVIGNCQAECKHHIEDKTGRRDTERVIPILVQHAQENIANNNWLPLARDKKQLDLELKRYDDIGARWRAKPEVQVILGIKV